ALGVSRPCGSWRLAGAPFQQLSRPAHVARLHERAALLDAAFFRRGLTLVVALDLDLDARGGSSEAARRVWACSAMRRARSVSPRISGTKRLTRLGRGLPHFMRVLHSVMVSCRLARVTPT